MEKDFEFYAGELKIEALLEAGAIPAGVVITHPHPQFGGDMYNPVVNTIRHAYRKKGYSTLRFNFRGTGKSQGRYDRGSGEQQDVLAAVKALRTTGLEAIDLAGYSFGSWVNARAVFAGLEIRRLVMVSPPVALLDFSDIGHLPKLKLVVTGGRDEIAPADQIGANIELWDKTAEFKTIEAADHFYTGCLELLEKALTA